VIVRKIGKDFYEPKKARFFTIGLIEVTRRIEKSVKMKKVIILNCLNALLATRQNLYNEFG
jgi:hypothetical protein